MRRVEDLPSSHAIFKKFDQCIDCGENEACPAWRQVEPRRGITGGLFVQILIALGATPKQAQDVLLWHLGGRSERILGE